MANFGDRDRQDFVPISRLQADFPILAVDNSKVLMGQEKRCTVKFPGNVRTNPAVPDGPLACVAI
jgi:hypothetical protein